MKKKIGLALVVTLVLMTALLFAGPLSAGYAAPVTGQDTYQEFNGGYGYSMR